MRIIAFALNLQRALYWSETQFLPNSTIIKLYHSKILIKRCYPSLRTLLRWYEVILSLMSTVARKFMHDRYPGRYF